MKNYMAGENPRYSNVFPIIEEGDPVNAEVTNMPIRRLAENDAALKEMVEKKADAEKGKGLSSNDYTDSEKEAVAGLNGLSFGQDGEGNWGYIAPGAGDAPGTGEVVPFGGGGTAVAVKCGAEAIGAGSIIVGKDGTYSTLKPGAVFDTIFPILYAPGGIEAGGTGTACTGALFPVQGQGLEPYMPVYVRGAFTSATLFEADSGTLLTQEIMPGNEWYEYIKLGTVAAGGEILMEREHPVYNSKLRGGTNLYSPMYNPVRNLIDGMLLHMIGLPFDRMGRRRLRSLKLAVNATAYQGVYSIKKDRYDKIIVVCTRAPRQYTSEPAQYAGFGNLENVLIVDVDKVKEAETVYYVSSGAAADQFGFRLEGDDILVSNKTGNISYSIWAEDRYGL